MTDVKRRFTGYASVRRGHLPAEPASGLTDGHLPAGQLGPDLGRDMVANIDMRESHPASVI